MYQPSRVAGAEVRAEVRAEREENTGAARAVDESPSRFSDVRMSWTCWKCVNHATAMRTTASPSQKIIVN